MRIHQVLGGTGSGDAVFTEALTLRGLLRQACPSEVFAPIANPLHDVPDIWELARRLESDGPDDTIVIVHALEDPLLRPFVETCRAPMVLRYHNITPAEYFRPWDPLFAKLLDIARRSLAEVADRFALSLADSTFNADELRTLGYDPIRVTPIVTNFARLSELPVLDPSSPMPRADGPVLTFVSRVAPNKGHVELIKAFAVVKRHLLPDAQLMIVGVCHTPRYRSMLDALVRRLALPDVIFTGQVSDTDLAAIYRRSAAFVSLSAHEGFGIPALESLSFGVPVVALRRGAVGETLGDAALLLDDSTPEMVAEAIHCVLTSDGLRSTLLGNGRRRLAELGVERTARQFVDALAPLITRPRAVAG